MAKRRKPTQADLDAANAEVRSLMDQVSFYKQAQANREADTLRVEDRIILNTFCKVMEHCHLPPNICAVAHLESSGDQIRGAILSLKVGDMKRLAEAIKRNMKE